jgi:hypothetical protein
VSESSARSPFHKLNFGSCIEIKVRAELEDGLVWFFYKQYRADSRAANTGATAVFNELQPKQYFQPLQWFSE